MTALKGCRVLVVEDEFYLAKDVKGILGAAGPEVIGPSGRERQGLAALEQHAFDCAVLDINTGQGSSFVLADALRAKGVPFLFFTGYDRAALPDRFSDAARLEKPVGTSRLVEAVGTICAASAAVRL